MGKIKFSKRASSIRNLMLACITIALCIHYHLFREYTKMAVRNTDDAAIPGTKQFFLAQQRRRRHQSENYQSMDSRKSQYFRSLSVPKNFTMTSLPTKEHNTSSFHDIHRVDAYTHPVDDISSSSKWAYSFLVSGCSEKKPGYKGFLYNCVVAATRLRELGSVADFVVLVQMSESTNSVSLPIEEEKMLLDNGIKIRYLPKMKSRDNECFYALVQEKFRVLQMIEYNRVLFIDSDIMPLCNLDYLFELSEPSGSVEFKHNESLLKENVIIAWRREAANAGLFMLKPSNYDWEQLQDVIRKKEEKALTLPWPHWDEVEGWGHKITPPDYWIGMNSNEKKTNWDWHAAFADQGLLYFWTKYIKKNVSIITGNSIEQWSTDKYDEEVHLEKIKSDDPLMKYSCFPKGNLAPPYSDFHHFTGRYKPWEQDLSRNVSEGTYTRHDGPLKMSSKQAELINLWRSIFLKAEERSSAFNLTFSWTGSPPEPPMGRFSTYSDMLRHIKSKKNYNWTHHKN